MEGGFCVVVVGADKMGWEDWILGDGINVVNRGRGNQEGETKETKKEEGGKRGGEKKRRNLHRQRGRKGSKTKTERGIFWVLNNYAHAASPPPASSKISRHATSINTNGDTTSSSFPTNPSFSFTDLELSLLES